MKLDFSQAFTERTPRVSNAAKLHRAAARKKASRFIVEGSNSVEAAVATGAATDVFVTEEAATQFEEILRAAGYMDTYIHPVTDKAAEKLSDTVTSSGLFAICKPVIWPVGKVLQGTPQLVAVCVETNDPGNAGTLIRIADVVGADAVIFAGDTVDPESSKAVRASAGSLFHIPVARSRDISDVMRQINNAGLQSCSTTMGGECRLDEAGEILTRPTAWLFGNEAHGLPQTLIDDADVRISIPIRGHAESLNLATAAAICLWESSKALNGSHE